MTGVAGRLQGRVAVVTGAGQGLGRAIAAVLCDAGASVALLGRTESKVADAAGEIRDAGGVALALRCDVAIREDAEAAVQATLDAYGRIDILVNNAQGGKLGVPTPTEGATDADILEFWTTGPLGSLHMMQAAFPALSDSKGAVLNFGSEIGVRGVAKMAGYAMAKEAIGALTKVTANEWGRYGIRVNQVCPAGLSPSAKAFQTADPKRWQAILRGIPLQRLGDPYDDIGRAVLALVSDDMTYLTGATLMLDGGRVLQR
jgi:NAD(P)-dependent dehydrogenase (short-subunit alcohol dehydrogenase family)